MRPTSSVRTRASAIVDSTGRPYTISSNHQAASTSSSELSNFNPRYLSADSAYLGERTKIVSRIQDLIRNDGWTSSTLNRFVDQGIGARFSLSYMPDHDALGIDFKTANAFRLQVETAWTQYAYDPRNFIDAAEKLNFAGLMGLAFRQRMAVGETLAVMRWISNRPWFVSRTAVQIVSPERLSNPNDASDTDTLRGGVELNAYGAPQRYWFRNRHPGDVFFGQSDRFKWEAVDRRTPWGRPIVIHQFEPEEPNQTRGKSALAAVVKKVFMANKYADTELQAAFVNAVLAAYIESPFDHETLAESMSKPEGIDGYNDARLNYHEKKKLTLGGATVPFLYPGEKIGGIEAARPNVNYPAFEERVLRYIAATTGQTYEDLAADYSKTNYSSARASMLGAWKYLTARRDHFGNHFATPIFAAWLEDAIDTGTVKLPDGAPDLWSAYAAYTQCAWNGPPRGWVDPTKEVQASIMRIEGGLTSLQQETAEAGDDWRINARQRAYEREVYKSLGLPDPSLQSMPAQPYPDDPNPDAADEEETAVSSGTSAERGLDARRRGPAKAKRASNADLVEIVAAASGKRERDQEMEALTGAVNAALGNVTGAMTALEARIAATTDAVVAALRAPKVVTRDSHGRVTGTSTEESAPHA